MSSITNKKCANNYQTYSKKKSYKLITFQFGVIFIIVEAIIWHTFAKDMTSEEQMTTSKGEIDKIKW